MAKYGNHDLTPKEEAMLLRSVADRVERGEIPVPPNYWASVVASQTAKTLREPSDSDMELVRKLADANNPKDVAAGLRVIADSVDPA